MISHISDLRGTMALFLDTFVNRLDRKGRISVPASFRASLANQEFQGIVVFPSFKYGALQCAGLDWVQNLVQGLGRVDLFSDEHDDLTATLFADAKQLAFDGDGRVMLPEILISHAELKEQAAFVGRGANFEIWNPEKLQSYKTQARQRALEKGRILRRSEGA